MHCLCLMSSGITNDFVTILLQMLTKDGNKSKFIRLVNPLLEYLRDSLRLSFCAAKRLPNKKWVSENYVAFARLVPFMYTTYFRNYSRQDSVTGRYALLVRKLVNSFNYLLSILMRPDQNQITKGVIDDAVKIYLQCLNNVDSSFGSELKGNIGIWTKQNPLSLLNLAEQIHKFGPLRFFWEGRNENKISQAKQYLNNTRETLSFYQSKLKRIRKKVSIDTIGRKLNEARVLDLNVRGVDDSSTREGEESSLESSSVEDTDDESSSVEDTDNENDSGDEGNEEEEEEELALFNNVSTVYDDEQDRGAAWYRGYYKYKNVEMLRINIEKGNFVSCLLFRDGLWACLKHPQSQRGSKTHMKVCQLRVGDESFKCCGSLFYHITVTNNVKLVPLMPGAIRNCLLMPFHSSHNGILFSNQFTIITDEWEVVNGNDLSITHPAIEMSLYDDIL